jgi:hypothetical protein
MVSKNPFQDHTDDALVGEAFSRQGTVGGPIAEMMRRLKVAIEIQERTSTELNKRIERLNVWLLVVTVAIGMMTLVQAAAAWRTLTR